jgi:hypothetical protein
MASKVPNPERADWYAKLGKCSSCPPEPGGSDNRWWRQKVYSHGHGYPPARNIWKTADGNTHKTLKDATAHESRTGLSSSVLSPAQGASKKMTPAGKAKLLAWEHFDYLPESTKKEVLGDKYKGDLE